MNRGGRDGKQACAPVPLFDSLYREHYRPVFAYLLGRTGDREAAADLLQETFLRVWQRIADLCPLPDDQRRYWLFAVARSRVGDYHRRRAVRERHAAALPDTLPAGSADADPARVVEARETGAAVDRAIAALPDDLRTVLVMHLLTEMTSAQVGQALGKPAGTVRYQLAQARRRIARALALTPDTDAVERRRG
jgi:RNA polymerase sigma-70 factor (ECF subfamily)